MELLPSVKGTKQKTPDIKLESLPEVVGAEMTDEELEEASRDAGMVVIDKRKIRGFHKIGKYLKQSGLVEIKRGRLAARIESLERARKVMLEIVEDKVICMGPDEKPVVHHTVVLAAAGALVAIVNAENESDQLDLKLEKIHQSAAPLMAGGPSNQIPPPNVPFVAIQSFNQHNHAGVAPKVIEVENSH